MTVSVSYVNLLRTVASLQPTTDTGVPVEAVAARLGRAVQPVVDDLDALARGHLVTVVMGAGAIHVRLTGAARVVLARWS